MSRPVWLSAVAAAVLKTTQAPDLDALNGELLREWGSSEVWRLSFGLRSVIVKRGTDTQYAEAAAYMRFVKPMGMPAPELIDLADSDSAVVLVLADVGRSTLEQEPTLDGFLAAAELLAEIRSKPVDEPSEFRLDELTAIEPLGEPLKQKLISHAGPALDALHREAPVAVVHGDFVAKNLVTDGRRWTAVDWPNAYLAPHLSDLYTLTRDAVALGHDRDQIIARYIDASGNDPDLVRRQLGLGGIGFTLRALHWIVNEGHRTVPESKEWIDPLVAELTELVEELQ